jgi:hypothetical protein
MRVSVLTFLVLLAAPGAVRADDHCSAPLSDWQPPKALVEKLEAEGWGDVAIRVHDGCYLVHAGNAQGESLHGLFDPATLVPVLGEGHGHHGDGGRHHHGPEN